ncbi:low affinity iron permease family protein [Candidatus Woesebacteria bacterium]|nr:low affinity iron permease family protein [Candidatus Woesebacteria bacterium]
MLGTMQNLFVRFAHFVSSWAGTSYAFVAAVSILSLWIVTGPVFHFSTTWQLFINTITTIVTFLMVFIIQNTQNRDTKAVHLKLDELIRAMKGARNKYLNAEELVDEELENLHIEFKKLADKYARELELRRKR